MKKSKDFNERMKKMKYSIKENKHILEGDTLDDVTIIGNPDFIKDPKILDEQETEEDKTCQKSKK
ncbi:hypothetical protein ACJJI5_05020 [Microbulbifer sp. EKSA008]|uniref:hypothetical protein n=1 Tax=Microbulbifer sp. EKSA008 TaxID=3243367 RepID=UPI004040F83D